MEGKPSKLFAGIESLLYAEDRPVTVAPTSQTQQHDQNEEPHADTTADIGTIRVVSSVPPLPAALVQYMQSREYTDDRRTRQHTSNLDPNLSATHRTHVPSPSSELQQSDFVYSPQAQHTTSPPSEFRDLYSPSVGSYFQTGSNTFSGS